MVEIAYVYILANGSKRLYIGITTARRQRIRQHKEHAFPDRFTARCNITQLVYFERWGDVHAAIEREKQLKKWSRVKKVQLIVRDNPDWRDLSLEWRKATEPFDGVLRPPVTLVADTMAEVG